MSLVGGVLIASAALGLLDSLLRLPGPLRIVLWSAGVAALCVLAYVRLAPALRFSPSLTTLALRLEQTPAGRAAGLPHRLASALELAGDPRPGASAVVADTLPRFNRAFVRAMRQAIDRGRLRRASVIVVGVAALITGAFLAWPLHSTIAARRVLTPWAEMDYPRRTEIADVTALVAHPRGQAVPLRAVVSSSVDVRDDVRVYFRLAGMHGATPWRTMLLNAQGAASEAQLAAARMSGRQRGTLFEGLVEPAADLAPPDAELVLEYWFQADDNRTDFGRVILASPPAVSSATAEISPPAYAAPYLGPGRELATGMRNLSILADERSVVGPILAGSRLTLRLELSKDVPVPEGEDGLDAALFLASTFPTELPPDFAALHEERRWTVWFTLERSLTLPVMLEDKYGIRSDERTVFRFEVVPDQPPTAAIIAPPRDQSVLATAIIETRAEARDDVGLERLELMAQRYRPDPDSGSRVPVPMEEPRRVAHAEPPPEAASAATADAMLDLSTLDLAPGDELWLLARVLDTHESRGERRPATVSRPRRLRIISETELVEQLRGELAVVRRLAAQADAEQRELMRGREEPDGERDRRDARAQEALGQRLEPGLRLLEELGRRLEQNRFRDEAVTGIIAQAQGALEQAGAASDRAAAALADAGAPRRDDQDRRRIEEQARREQQEVRDALARAMDALDQGQEGWLARRSIERLIDDQQRLTNQTRLAGEQTAGRLPEQLTPDQRRQLDSLAQQQRDLAQRGEQAASRLREAAQRVRESDPALSESLRRAADQAQQAQLARQQRQAADQILRNQPGQAQQLQQQSRQTLEQMLRELERAARRRDEVLSRQLADLIETLDRLIRTQEAEIAILAAALTGPPPDLPDAGMRNLHRDTLALVDELTAGQNEIASVAPTLRAAGEAQARAIVKLRADPPDYAGADPHERESLQRLTQARADAQDLLNKSRQRDLQRRRAELASEYARALEEQKVISAETVSLAGRELSRRDRVAARLLGQRQEALRTSLEELQTRTTDIAQAAVFLFAHRRIDSASRAASEPLALGEVTPGVLRGQNTVEIILAGLIEALRNPEDDSPFRDDDAGGSGSGSGGRQGQPPLVPELAELRLLRLMQQEAAERTRALAEPDQTADPSEVEAVAQLQHDLAEHARALLEKLMQNEGGGRRAPRPGETPP
jgi:hypothetical protein